MSKASSEHCLAHILAPGAYARMPMVERMAPLRMPVSFIYGATGIDWMVSCRVVDVAGANADPRGCRTSRAAKRLCAASSRQAIALRAALRCRMPDTTCTWTTRR